MVNAIISNDSVPWNHSKNQAAKVLSKIWILLRALGAIQLHCGCINSVCTMLEIDWN